MYKVYKKNNDFFFECEEGKGTLVGAWDEKVPFSINKDGKKVWFYSVEPETDEIVGFGTLVIAEVTERGDGWEITNHQPIGESFPDGTTDIVLTDHDLYGYEETITWECNGITHN